MAQEFAGPSTPMSALDELDVESAFVLREVLSKSDPALLRTLEASNEPAREAREQVIDVVVEEFNDHVSGPPDWEPTVWGKRVDNALGWFLHRFPIES